MSIDLIELAQHEAAWLAYGKRRASRLRWKKTTNADVAVGLDVQAVTKKIEAHDKRLGFVRWMIRRFTKIERNRELLVYRLGNDMLIALKASSTMATLKAQQPNLDKITSLTARASWFSWFKKPLNAFTGWVNQTIAGFEPQNHHKIQSNTDTTQAIPVAVLPVELDTKAALDRFHERVTKDKHAIVAIYKECEIGFHTMHNMPTAEKAEKFNTCFEPFKKKLRELQLYYHPDKALAARAIAVGLKHETFAVQVAIAFKEIIKPAYEAIIVKRDKIKDSIEQSLEIDRLLAWIKEADLAFWKNVDELRESNARLDEKLKTHCENVDAYVKRVDAFGEKIEVASQQAEESKRRNKELEKAISILEGQVNYLLSASFAGDVKPVLTDIFNAEPLPNKQPLVSDPTPLTNPMLSTYPALFAVKPTSDACGQQLSTANSVDDVTMLRQVPVN